MVGFVLSLDGRVTATDLRPAHRLYGSKVGTRYRRVVMHISKHFDRPDLDGEGVVRRRDRQGGLSSRRQRVPTQTNEQNEESHRWLLCVNVAYLNWRAA
jgi:sRNA-binding protein